MLQRLRTHYIFLVALSVCLVSGTRPVKMKNNMIVKRTTAYEPLNVHLTPHTSRNVPCGIHYSQQLFVRIVVRASRGAVREYVFESCIIIMRHEALPWRLEAFAVFSVCMYVD